MCWLKNDTHQPGARSTARWAGKIGMVLQ
jgi:hypothetical protein